MHLNIRNKMAKNTDIFDDYFSKFKEYLDDSGLQKNSFATVGLIEELKKETKSLIEMCEKINNDEKSLKALNALVKNDGPKIKVLRAEHFFLSDLIGVYNQQLSNETKKSRYILAYYFTAFNNHFNKNDDMILSQLSFNSESHANHSFLITALSKTNVPILEETLNGFDKFASLSFGLNIDKDAIARIIASAKNLPKEVPNADVDIIPEGDSLDKVMEELNQLIGLERVKTDVKELINLLEVQKLRDAEGLKNIEVTLHNVFLGPPGTGKTSVARLLARIYYHLGFLSKGQMYETDREGLIAGFVGQTATKVDKAVQDSLGGVLFIDEAYALTQNLLSNDYGSEAVNTLLKRMEDHRQDLSVVVAGYTAPMKEFIESNPGLRSRFNRYFYFDHFTSAQLLQIFEGFCSKSDFILDEDAKEKLSDTLNLLVDKRDDSFGNARVVRNLFEKIVQNQANRIIKIKKPSKKRLRTFTEEDIPEPKETLEHVMLTLN